MAVKVLSGPLHECSRDGHLIALRLRYEPDGPEVSVTPVCEACRLVFLPSSSMSGSQADWLMKLVAQACKAPAATPEAHEGMFE